MSVKYPEPSDSKIEKIQKSQTKKQLVVIPAIAICFAIWGSAVYGYGDFIPDILVTVAMCMILPLCLMMIFTKCPKCDRYNCQVACSVCKFQLAKKT